MPAISIQPDALGSSVPPLVLTDPVARPIERPWLIQRIGLSMIRDPRDLTFLAHMIVLSIVVMGTAALFYVLDITGRFEWWMGLIYFAVLHGDLLARFMLMQHNAAHRTLFTKKLRILNLYIPWVLGPFFGQTPNTYFSHHIGMHHPENNLEEDDSCTMPYQRDSILGFAHYYITFIFTGMFSLVSYLRRKNRHRLAREALIGEVIWIAVAVGLMFVAPWATLWIFILPLFTVRFLMMSGNWGQHAFIDAAEPGNCYRNSITCINVRYNKVAFNDGYHISHHLKATRHWTEHPQELLDNLETYGREDAIVFTGIDFHGVWVLLMLKQYRWLARHFVKLPGAPDRSLDEIVALLRERTRRIPPGQPTPATKTGQATGPASDQVA
ncbi:MAG: fatty acid desaturase [Planctomycetota bacterium]